MKKFCFVCVLILCALEFHTAQELLTEPTSQSPEPPAFTMDPPTTYEFKFNRSNNHLNISFDKTKRSNNYFLTLGDWGQHDGGDRSCQNKVGKSMQDYVANMTKQGKTLLFIAALGDNFYWHGMDKCHTNGSDNW